jgi:hypothetical protein
MIEGYLAIFSQSLAQSLTAFQLSNINFGYHF